MTVPLPDQLGSKQAAARGNRAAAFHIFRKKVEKTADATSCCQIEH